MVEQAEVSQKKFFRLSLRSALLLVLVAGLLLAWGTSPWLRMRRQQSIIARIRATKDDVQHGSVYNYDPLYLGVTARPDRSLSSWLKGNSIVPEISSLELNGPLDESDIRLLGQLDSLRALSINGRWFDEDCAMALSSCSELLSLQLKNCVVTAQFVNNLHELDGLVVIAILDCELTDDALRALPSLAGLRFIRIKSLPTDKSVTDDGIASLANIPNLETVVLIGFPAISDSGIEPLVSNNRLLTLRLSSVGITDETLLSIGRSTSMRYLRLTNCNISDSGVRTLAANDTLHRLQIGSAPLTDLSLDSLAGVLSLETLELYGTNITPAGVKRFQQLRPNINVIRY